MTPDRLRAILALLHWSQRGLADVLGCSDSLTREWARGKQTIPQAIAEWLERLAAAHEANPVPADWRRPRFGRAA
jgi:transcriptional regulator with XRE-family HTH domain